METRLEYTIERIGSINRIHGKKIRNNVKNFDNEYFIRAEQFLEKYETLLIDHDKTLDYAIDCYLQMLADINYEAVQFFQTGTYSSKSFAEVNKRVYSNPDVMEYYMHGLLLSQFLWTYHYNILLFFNKIIQEHSNNIRNYLEVGGGHGLYISEALKITRGKVRFDIVDISQSSIEIARKMTNNDNISFIHSDIMEYQPASKYDFITLGEVLEHVEHPDELLKKLHSMLNDDGRLFITTPTNAPAIDHIYLFKNAEEIRNIISSAGFETENELCAYSEYMPAELAEKHKVTMMYAAVLKKSMK
jgi:2-polyprenyl-3-methyl-5-hydroxy-6-metoxy-1,4-benzoquinol methylase